MNKQQILAILVIGLVALSMISAVYAKKEEVECVPKPIEGISIASVTQSFAFLFSGGMGPLLILALALIIGMIVSYLIWGGGF